MILNFLKEDYSDVIGVYYDGEKITLSHHVNGAIESAEVIFSLEDDISEIEQLAEKISVICSQRGWKTSKMGLCLREGAAVTFQTQLNIPSTEIENAVKSWAIAQIGEDSLYTSVQFDDEIWMETITQSAAKEYVNAWQKNSMTLCALTVKPEKISAQSNLTKPIEYADFVADIVKNKKAPNFLNEYLSAWNYKKISAAIVALFFFVLVGIFLTTSYEYYAATAQLEQIQAILAEHDDELRLKNSIDENISEMKRLNELCAAQSDSVPTFNALVKLGKIADGKTYLTKLKISANTVELEGIADNPDEIKNYVSRLKTNITPNVKLGNVSSTDDATTFTVHLTLQD